MIGSTGASSLFNLDTDDDSIHMRLVSSPRRLRLGQAMKHMILVFRVPELKVTNTAPYPVTESGASVVF